MVLSNFCIEVLIVGPRAVATKNPGIAANGLEASILRESSFKNISDAPMVLSLATDCIFFRISFPYALRLGVPSVPTIPKEPI